MIQPHSFRSFFRREDREKVSLGNSSVRYNSEVEDIRRKYFINPTRNSEDVPDWMSRTKEQYYKGNMRGRSMPIQTGNTSCFVTISEPKAFASKVNNNNISGQFQSVYRKKPRTNWEMKNHTFELEWPKQQFSQRVPISNPEAVPIIQNSKRDFSFRMPKYFMKKSPLHVQQSTTLKIGHSSCVDSICVK